VPSVWLSTLISLTEFLCQNTPRTKAHTKFSVKSPLTLENTIGRADKLALVTRVVLIIYLKEFKDYSNIIKKFYYSYITIIK
jgi:hypothetical protein